MKYLAVLLLICAPALFAGESVEVTVTAPPDVETFPYDGYFIYYEDSIGEQFTVRIEGKNNLNVIIPDVAYGLSKWQASSSCLVCAIKESERIPAPALEFKVVENIGPSPPGKITISITITVN